MPASTSNETPICAVAPLMSTTYWAAAGGGMPPFNHDIWNQRLGQAVRQAAIQWLERGE